jgi:hypothetical protein
VGPFSNTGPSRGWRPGRSAPVGVLERVGHVVVVIALIVVTVVAVAGGLARAATSWEATNLPGIGGGPPGSFEASPAVSCVSATSCVAVGSYEPVGVSSLTLGGGTTPMADELTGTSWSAVVLPVPAGGSEVSMSAVSCSSATACVAVGEYSPPGGGERPLVETLSQGTWMFTTPPFPPQAYFASLSPVPLLGSVSCLSSTSCVAVGVYPIHTGRTLPCCYRYSPLIETLTGTTWTASTAPTPRRSSDGSLSSVSCAARGGCVAVGNVTTTTGTAPLVETLTGSRWTATTLPAPPGGSFPAPFPWSVSCVVSQCTALGADLSGGGDGGLVVETLSGGHWSPATLPLPAGGSYGFPFAYEPQSGVSCVAAGSCVAVSTYEADGGAPDGMAAELSAGTWTSVSLPSPAGGTSPFPQAASCVAPGSCVSVGSYQPGGGGEGSLSETLSGTTWTASALPLPSALPVASLTALSCTSTSTCVAVGNAYGADHAQDPFAEILSGTTWTTAALPLPAQTVASGDTRPLVQGLSCASASACVAVGYDPGPALTEHPLAEVMSGSTWKAERLPLPSGFRNQSASLSGVTCVSATSCVAVGVLGSEADALIETLTAGAWVATAVAPPDGDPRIWLSSVSCSSASSCVAVGAYWGSNPGFSRPLAATLSGKGWHVRKLAVPPGSLNTVAFTVPMLQSVSCVSSSACVAVGFYPRSFDDSAPLVEALTGTRWRATTASVPVGADWTLLWGLSCVSTGSCTAVGEDNGLPLAEVLSGGVWTAVPVITPAGDTGASLQAVTCTAAGLCTAAGGGTGVSGVYPVVAADPT